MQGGDAEENEGVEIRPYLEDRRLEREAQEKREQQKWSYKWHHLPIREKIYVFGIIISIAISISTVFIMAFVIPAMQPHPDTQVEYCIFSMGKGNDWEVIKLKIVNKGNDDSSKITVELSLPDNMTFYYVDSLNNKYSRPPDNMYQEDNLLVLSWDYLLPHTGSVTYRVIQTFIFSV